MSSLPRSSNDGALIQPTIEHSARQARIASRQIASLATEQKHRVLRELADRIDGSVAALLDANQHDLSAARVAGLGDAKLARLALTEAGIHQLAEGVRTLIALADPTGQVVREYVTDRGLRVKKVRVPIGVILMIYEARPGVTVDAFSLCFKAGNACLLKGGREAIRSNEMLASLAHAALDASGIDRHALTLLTSSSRDELRHLLTLTESIDLVIPRGGEELIRFVHQHSRIPTIQHFRGVCHIFVDASAQLDRALDVCTTAKTSAPATCNAVETILIHRAIASAFVPALVARYRQLGVEVRGDTTVASLGEGVTPAAETDWGREFLDRIVAVRVVDDVHAAIAHIAIHGSNHTDAILTERRETADLFVREVASSCVLVNASTRFNDGFQLGLGAEIGISTSRIHAYGPMGLEELTIPRYVVAGQYDTR